MLFSRVLENSGEDDLNRVAKLAQRFDEEVGFNYVNAVFSTIGKTEQNEKTKGAISWRMVDKDIAERLFLKFGNRLDVATEYSRAMKKDQAKIGAMKFCLGYLKSQ